MEWKIFSPWGGNHIPSEAGSCAIDFQTESVLALNKKLKFPIHFFWISSPYAAVLGYKNGSAIDQTTL